MDLAYQEFLQEVLWQARKQGAEYADCRLYPQVKTEEIKIENGQISKLNSSLSSGFSVRALIKGTWGFYATPLVLRKKITEAVKRAAHSASTNAAIQKEKVILAPSAVKGLAPNSQIYRTKTEIDPFQISTEQKLVLLASADEAMRQGSKKAFRRIAELTAQRTQKLFASTDGVFHDQTILETGVFVQAHARNKRGDDVQRRSYPDSHLSSMQGGHEMIEKLDLAQNAGRIAQEAEQLLTAPPAPSGKRGVILLPEMLNLLCHEIAHGFEADRILGTEWTLAGGSFLAPLLPRIGSFRFGSPQVNLIADGLMEHGAGTLAFDEEGTRSQRVPLVKQGIWVGLLTSRQTVPQLNSRIGKRYFRHSSGGMRAEAYDSRPVIRMTNILLEPGNTDFEALKDSVPNGTIMFGTNKSRRIDNMQRRFSFGAEIAWEKVRGDWELRKNAEYEGDNLHFWRNCQSVCNKKSFWLAGLGACGNAGPFQTIHTGHGSSPAYFTNVRISSLT